MFGEKRKVVRFAKKRGVVGLDDVEKLHQLLTGSVGLQVIQVAAFVVEAQGAHALAHPSGRPEFEPDR